MDIQGVWESFLDIIYPRDVRCDICHIRRDDILDYGICPSCEDRLPYIEPPLCPKCGKMMLSEDKLCLDCEEISHTFYRGISVFEFSTEVRDLIHRYKYRGNKYLSVPMVHWMTQALISYNWDFDTIVPVPLHPARARQRGFNQANLLARGLSKNIGVPLVNKSLIRIKDTPHQTRLSRQEREQNLTGAFKIRDKDRGQKVFHGKTILLVDDVYTTGNTADQCTRVLLEGGASKVYVITLATGSNI